MMNNTVVTLHYSAERENEINSFREKYTVYGGRVKHAKLTAKQRAQAAGITTGVLSVAMAILGVFCTGSWHVIPMGIALYIAGLAGMLAAKPVYQYFIANGDQEDAK